MTTAHSGLPASTQTGLALSLDAEALLYLASASTDEKHTYLKAAANTLLANLVVARNLCGGNALPNQPQVKVNSIINQLADDLEDNPQLKQALCKDLRLVDWQSISDRLADEQIALDKPQPPPDERVMFINSIHISNQRSNEQQEMIAYIARQNPNDSMNISGYAGVGKTTMIQRLAGEFDSTHTVVLAKTKWQWQFLKRRVSSNIRVLTVDRLNEFILSNNNAEALWGNRYNLPYNFNSYIKALNLTPMNGMTKEQVASIVGQQVLNFCESENENIETYHFPVDLLLQYCVSSVEKIHSFPVFVYTKLARELWNKIMRKTAKGDLAITPQHALKFMDLTQTTLPGWINHVIIDESHDLSPVFSNILKRSKQVIISLGDEYQITDNKPRLSLDQDMIRKSTICDSERTGYNLSDLINFVIGQHDSIKALDPFSGSKKKTTEILTYQDFKIPNEPCTILSDEYWYILLAMHQMTESSRPFYLMKETKAQIDNFIQQALRLFEGRKVVLQYHDLISYDNWQQLVQERGYTNGLMQVDRLFKSGFDTYKWKGLLRRALDRPQKSCWIIGKATEAKSLEFDNVLLAPDIVNVYKIKDAMTQEDRKRQLNKIYTALTRGKLKIFLPKSESHWLLDSLL